MAEKKEQMAADPKDVEENKAIAILSYLGILCLVPLLAKKESKFAQFHAKQGVVLLIGYLLASILTPVFGLGLIVWLASIILSIIGIVSVAKGEMKELPLIGQFGSKINL